MTFKNYCYRDIFYDHRSFEKSSTLTLAFFLKLSKPFGTVNQTTFFTSITNFGVIFMRDDPIFSRKKNWGCQWENLDNLLLRQITKHLKKITPSVTLFYYLKNS